MTLGLQKQWPTIDRDLNRKRPSSPAGSGVGVARMKTCHSGSESSDTTIDNTVNTSGPGWSRDMWSAIQTWQQSH